MPRPTAPTRRWMDRALHAAVAAGCHDGPATLVHARRELAAQYALSATAASAGAAAAHAYRAHRWGAELEELLAGG